MRLPKLSARIRWASLPAAWQNARRRLRRNAGLRVVSVAIAIGLWMFVNAAGTGGLALDVPISYRTLPPGSVIINHPPDFVKLEVTGPRTILSLLEPERLTLRLNLAGVGTGQTDFKIYPTMFNVPRGTAVTRITPSDVTLDIDRVVSRDVPIHLTLQGSVEAGYKIASMELRPPTVSVSGPSRYVMSLQVAQTEPLDVHGATAPLEGFVDLAEPALPVRLSGTRVDARVDIAEEIADREFRGIGVEVRDSGYRYKVMPDKATVTLRGPAIKLAGVDPKGLLFVDARGVEPGNHDLPVQVNLPEGMQLVKQAPERVKLRMYRERRTTGSDDRPS